MKLQQLNIVSFGKLKDTEINFSDNFNVVYGLNEAGKTTLHNFIYSAFFGAKKDKINDFLSIREYYAPWYTSIFSGALIFSLKNSKNFKIFRNFEKKGEKLELIDLSNGVNIINNFPETFTRPKESMFADILLGVSREVFKDTVFINQAKIAVMEDAGKLSEVLQSVISTGTENNTSRKAIDKLDEAASKVGTERAPTKEFFKINNGIIELGRKKEEIEAKRQSLKDLFARKKQLNEEKENLQVKIEKSSAVIYLSSLKTLKDKILSLKQALFNMKQTRLESEEVKNQISEYEKRINLLKEKYSNFIADNTGRIKDENELSGIRYYIEEIKKINEEKIITDDQRKRTEEKICAYKDKSKNILQLAVFAVVVLIVSLVSYFTFKNKFVLYFSFIFTAVNMILGIYVVFNILEIKKSSDILKTLSILLQDAGKHEREINEKINAYFKSLGADNYEDLKHRIEDINKLDGLIKTKYETKLSIDKRLHMESEHYNRQVSDINNYMAKLQLKDIVLSEDVESSVSFLEDKIKKEAEELNINPAEIGEREEFIKNTVQIRLNDMEKELSHLQGIEKQATVDLEDISEVEEELEKLEERRNQIVLYLKAIDEAKNILEEINVDYHREVFAPELTSCAADIIGRITNKYKNIFFDKDFNIRVELSDNLGVKNVENLSLGTKEQFYLALKIALGKYLSLKGELLPLILDDALTNFDEERRRNTLEFLIDLSNQIQVIICTSDINQYNQVKDILNSRGMDFNEETKAELTILRGCFDKIAGRNDKFE